LKYTEAPVKQNTPNIPDAEKTPVASAKQSTVVLQTPVQHSPREEVKTPEPTATATSPRRVVQPFADDEIAEIANGIDEATVKRMLRDHQQERSPFA
jgi:hypothetical protein